MKNMIYFNKLIDICINRYESQKVVDNYFVGTNRRMLKNSLCLRIQVVFSLALVEVSANNLRRFY